jgi:hypothetical protein
MGFFMMLYENAFCSILFFATLDAALIGSISGMNSKMCLQNTLLIKGLRAALHRAFENFI